jgi:gluconate 5-dehydrogenase
MYVNDVTQKKKHGDLILNIENNIGPISILVNNAGTHCKKPSIETTDEEFQSVMDTNINAVFALTREVLKFMIPRKKGSIINISSMTAFYGLPQVAAYSSSKSALSGLTRTLASEYSHLGIRFNSVAPGFIESEMFRNIMRKDPDREKKILSRTPAGRFGTPGDIGKAVVFLASDAADFITGVCLPVDGGNSIGF